MGFRLPLADGGCGSPWVGFRSPWVAIGGFRSPRIAVGGFKSHEWPWGCCSPWAAMVCSPWATAVMVGG